MALLLKMDPVAGDATTSGYVGWIELQSFGWGWPGKPEQPPGSNDEKRFHVTKAPDLATARLMTACDRAEHLDKGTVAWVDLSNPRVPAGKLTIWFDDVSVSR